MRSRAISFIQPIAPATATRKASNWLITGEARAVAIKHAGDLLSHQPEHLRNDADFRIEDTDENDMMLYTVVMLAVDAPATGRPPTGLKYDKTLEQLHALHS